MRDNSPEVDQSFDIDHALDSALGAEARFWLACIHVEQILANRKEAGSEVLREVATDVARVSHGHYELLEARQSPEHTMRDQLRDLAASCDIARARYGELSETAKRNGERELADWFSAAGASKKSQLERIKRLIRPK